MWPHTLRRWEREGKLKPLRTPGGQNKKTNQERGEKPGILAASQKTIVWMG